MRRFIPSDLPQVNSWYVAHQKPPVRITLLPQHGMIEENVAAGFLYRTDSAVCFLDGYISNPAAPLLTRYRAFIDITDRLIEYAKDRGAAHVIALCKARGIVKLAVRFGLRATGTYVLAEREIQ